MRTQRNLALAFSGSLIVLIFFFVMAVPSASAREQSSAKEMERVDNAIAALQELTGIPDQGIPVKLMQNCSGMAIIPGVIKAAWGVGGQYGKGVIVLRGETGEWSDPVFIGIYGGSVGWQIGVQRADIILVFKNRMTVHNVANGKITLGADVSATAGPVGRTAQADTDIAFKAEILSYSKSRGLFAGVSIKGATIQIDKDANRVFYGNPRISVEEIFSGQGVKAPAQVQKLKDLLAQYSK